jgi:hypothetical protein
MPFALLMPGAPSDPGDSDLFAAVFIGIHKWPVDGG